MSDLDDLFGPPTPLILLAMDLVRNCEDLKRSLKSRRLQQGLSVSDVADRLGTTVAAVREFESYNSDPRLSQIRRYALALNVSFDIEVED